MARVTTVLPWRHDSELAFVRDCFYPHHTSVEIDIYSAPLPVDTDDSDSHKPENSFGRSTSTSKTDLEVYSAGLRRVAIWTFRSPRSVPHAVVATAGLIEAKVHDVDRTGGGDGVNDRVGGFRVSEMAMRSIYAMAVLRFVNGFVDRDVSRSVRRFGLSKIDTAGGGDEEEENVDEPLSATGMVVVGAARAAGESSMYAHAATIGMPTQFVDLRHRCVHGELPELVVLRRMTGRALEWLWDRWWKGNATGDSGRFKWEMEGEEGGGSG